MHVILNIMTKPHTFYIYYESRVIAVSSVSTPYELSTHYS